MGGLHDPEGRLVEGRNTFMVFKAHDPKYKTTFSWRYNNLRIGIDKNHDQDHSWYFGGAGDRCCVEFKDLCRDAEKPLFRTAKIIQEHRQVGYRECKGELMIFLELSNLEERR